MAEDDDLSLPRAAINKLIKETLPQLRVSVETRDLIANCCNEFIHLLGSEGNEICNKQEKKTIMPEHIVEALDSLGFGSYVKDCERVLKECKHIASKKRRGSSRLENLGIPEEELLRQQQELFAQARREQFEQEQREREEYLQSQGLPSQLQQPQEEQLDQKLLHQQQLEVQQQHQQQLETQHQQQSESMELREQNSEKPLKMVVCEDETTAAASQMSQ